MRKEQGVRNNATGATGYVTVADSTTYADKHQPTSAELATLKPSLPTGYTWSVVGPSGVGGFDYSYLFSRSGTDFAGNSFVSSPAPILVSIPRNKPRQSGNDYTFPAQTALNVALHKRFPTFQTHARKIIIYPGGLFNDAGDNEMIGRGWTHVSESTKATGESVYPTQYKRAIEHSFYGPAYYKAMSLPDSDPRKAKLLAWSSTPDIQFDGNHYLIDDDATARLYAVAWVDVFEQPDWKGGGVEYFSVNHEKYVGSYSGYFHHQGLMTRAIIDEMASRFDNGVRRYPIAKSGLSDFGALVTVSPYARDRRASGHSDILQGEIPDPDNSVPQWLHFSLGLSQPFNGSSRANPLSDSAILGQLLKAGKAFAGCGQYMQHTMDEQSYFVKNNDGSYLLDGNGWLTWRAEDPRTTTITGESCPIYADDYHLAMKKLYGYFAQFYALYFFRAGSQHLPMSNAAANGWDNLRFYAQFRLNTEVVSGRWGGSDAQAYNRRPLNPDHTELFGAGMYLFVDYMRGWMESQNKSTLGAASPNDNQSRASVEQYAKGFQRAADLNWMQDTPWQFVVPKFFLFEQSSNTDEQFWTKPIIIGGLTTYLGKPTIWMLWAWPCQDADKSIDILMWVDKGAGALTGSYQLRCQGRKTGLDWWHLPDACAGMTPKDIYYQFRNFKNELVTWRGDYREAKITSHPTPPSVAS